LVKEGCCASLRSALNNEFTLMNPLGNPNIAAIKPFQRGNSAPRRSRDVDRALREYRKLTPEAAKFVGKVLRDETEDTRLRLKAAEIIALHGMPKGDAARKAALDNASSLRIEFVAADGSLVTFQQDAPGERKLIDAEPPRIIEMPFHDDGSDES